MFLLPVSPVPFRQISYYKTRAYSETSAVGGKYVFFFLGGGRDITNHVGCENKSISAFFTYHPLYLTFSHPNRVRYADQKQVLQTEKSES